jgi:hypothetical protein
VTVTETKMHMGGVVSKEVSLECSGRDRHLEAAVRNRKAPLWQNSTKEVWVEKHQPFKRAVRLAMSSESKLRFC